MSAKKTLNKLVTASLLAALVCAATMIIKIPSPLNGYINLGDAVVVLAGMILSPVYGFLACGIGSALADLFSGYVIYAPITFVIKGAMAVIVFYIARLLSKRIKPFASQLIGCFLAEVFMILGYFVFEGILYGFVPSATNIPANAVQGCAGIILGLILIKALKNIKSISRYMDQK